MQAGVTKTFMWVGSVQVVVCLLSILMCKHRILKLVGIVFDNMFPQMCSERKTGASVTDTTFSSLLVWLDVFSILLDIGGNIS